MLYHLSECFPRAMRGLYYFTQLLRYLTHTGVGISPIQVLVSHPYRCWCLTHTHNEVSLIELSANQGVASSHSTSSHKTPIRHLRSRLLVSTTSSHSSSPPRPFRHLRLRLLVSTTASHSSSPLRPFRHLFVLPFVISSFSLPSSPSSVTRHLSALSLVISQL